MTIRYTRRVVPLAFAQVAALDPNVWDLMRQCCPALPPHNDAGGRNRHAIRRALCDVLDTRLTPGSWSYGCISVHDQHGPMRVWGIVVRSIGALYLPQISISDFLQSRGVPTADHCASFGGQWYWAESVAIEEPHGGVSGIPIQDRKVLHGQVRGHGRVLWAYARQVLCEEGLTVQDRIARSVFPDHPSTSRETH